MCVCVLPEKKLTIKHAAADFLSYWCIKGHALERGGLLISLKNSDPSPQRCACVAHDAIFISQKAKGCGLVWLATAPENDLRRVSLKVSTSTQNQSAFAAGSCTFIF
jgi:hypothetical protein